MDRRPPIPTGFYQGAGRSVGPASAGSTGGNPPIVLADGPPQAQALLEPTIYVKIDEDGDKSLTLVIPFGGFEVGETKLTKSHCLKIRSILEERINCKKQLKMVLSRSVSVAHFNRLWECGSPNAAMFDWRDPNNPSRTSTFFVKRVKAQQLLKPAGVGGVTSGTFPGIASSRAPFQSGQSRAPSVPSSFTSNPARFATRSGTGVSSTAVRHSAPTILQNRNKQKRKPVEIIDIDSSEGTSTSDSDEEEEMQQNTMYLSSQKNVSVSIMKPGEIEKKNSSSSVSSAKSVSSVSSRSPAITKPAPSSNIEQVKKDASRTSVMVVKGGRVFQNKKIVWRLPGKTIVPAEKKLQVLYRIPNISGFQKTHYNVKKPIAYEYHPFLGKEVIVAVPPPREELAPPPIKKQKSLFESENTVPAVNVSKKPTRKAEDFSESSPSSDSEDDRRRLRTRQAKSKHGSSISTKSSVSDKQQLSANLEKRVVPVRKRVLLREMTDSSSSSSSSSSGSGSSDSESDSDPEFVKVNSGEDDDRKLSRNPSGKSRNPLSSNNSNIKSNAAKNLRSQNQPPPVRRYDKGYPDFGKVDCNMPLRKDGDGRIYFDTTSRLKSSQFHTNEDIFVNWDKFVRNESGVGSFFKTIIRHKDPLCFLMIFHLDYDEDTFVPKVDRSIELCSDGSVRVFLEGIDVTSIFFSYMDIRTNHDLMAMLLNLQHSYTCPGAGRDLDSVSVCPSGEHVLRNGQWFSAGCKKIVFDRDHALFKMKSRCGPCNTLRKNLCIEKIEIDKNQKVLEAAERKKIKKAPKLTHTKIIREKELETPKLQVRESLAVFLKQMWRDMGLTELQEDLPVDEKPLDENGKVPEVLESSSVPPVGEEVSVKQDGGTGVNLPIQEGTATEVTSAPVSLAVPPALSSCMFSGLPTSQFQPPPILSDTPDLLTLSDLTFSSAEINAMIPEDFTSLEMMMNSSGEGSSLLFGDVTPGPFGHQMQQPPMPYPPQQPNSNFMYSQEAADVTSTTGSVQGSIMCSGVFGGPVNHNVAVPVGESSPVIPNSTNNTDSSSLAGAISMSLLFPTFEDML